jgi:hypothetical protein
MEGILELNYGFCTKVIMFLGASEDTWSTSYYENKRRDSTLVNFKWLF